MANTWVALIRGIGPTTHPKMSMGDLRAAAEQAGFANVRTLLATGNLVFEAGGTVGDLAIAVDRITEGFGLSDNPAILRNRSDLLSIRETCPFPEAAANRPSKLLAVFLSDGPSAEAVAALEPHAKSERLALIGQTLWIDYVDGVGRSPLTAARIDRATGVAGTARNWNTLGKLIDAMA